MSAVLDNFQHAQSELLKRIAELEPMVAEYEELTRIAQRLDPDAPGAGLGSDGARSRNRSAGRTRSSGGRREDILRIVAESPGVTINQLGKLLETDPTGLYRPVRALVGDGQLDKDGPNLYIKSVVTGLRPVPQPHVGAA